jgi:hypothetical protein
VGVPPLRAAAVDCDTLISFGSALMVNSTLRRVLQDQDGGGLNGGERQETNNDQEQQCTSSEFSFSVACSTRSPLL